MNVGKPRTLLQLLLLQLKILFFCATKEELLSLGRREFYLGILLVWLAGVGRVWQNAGANWFIHSGFSSVIYVYVLGIYLWIQLALVRAENWNLGRLITFICLTAPPALLFAVPFERFFSAYFAELIVLAIFIIVAIWRLSLLAWYAALTANLSPFRFGVALFLPLSVLITSTVWLDAVYSPFGYIGRMRRELRRALPITYTNPNQTKNRTKSKNQISPHVTSGSTGWLTQKGREIAESPIIPFHLFNNFSSQTSTPEYLETINTPDGPVDIFVLWTLGKPAGRAPAGFEYLNPYDAIYEYRHPLIRLISSLVPICVFGFIPCLLAYFVLMFMKPKKKVMQRQK